MNASSAPAQGHCVKCGGTQDLGFLLEMAHGNSYSATKWVAGVPEKSFWWGLKVEGKAQYSVQTYRCRNCGYLESYAL